MTDTRSRDAKQRTLDNPGETSLEDRHIDEKVDDDGTTPLGFVAKEDRVRVARERVTDRAIDLLNAAAEARRHDWDLRKRHSQVEHVARAVAAACQGLANLDDLERVALKLVRHQLIADDYTPRERYRADDFGEVDHKASLLAMIAMVCEGQIETSRYERNVRVQFQAVDAAVREDRKSKDHGDTAARVARSLCGWVEAVEAFEKLFPKPPIANNTIEDVRRLESALGVLLDDDAATVPNIARTIGHVFGLADVKYFPGDVAEDRWLERARAAREEQEVK